MQKAYQFFLKYKYQLLLGLIIILGAFLRLYRIRDYMGFLGDEGRDALVVKRMIIDHKFTLLGPITSVGLMYLGPAYYYFMLPFLWLFRLDPVGPAVMVALFSLATIYLMFKLCQEFFDEKTGVIASLFYAISPLVIIHSHSSWNPNIIPFWALLIIYGLMKVIIQQKYKWLIVVGLSLGILVQLHYIAFVFFPITLIILALIKFRIPIKYYFLGIISALFTASPFILFEIRHQFINTITTFQFVTRNDGTNTFGLKVFFYRFWDLTIRLFWRLIVIDNAEYTFVLLAIILVSLYFIIKHTKLKTRSILALKIMLIWYMVGFLCLSLYLGSLYDYYLMFIFPLPFMVVGFVISYLLSQKNIFKISAVLLIAILGLFQIKQTPILQPPNRLVYQTQTIADFILEQTHNQPYNFALIAAKNSDHAYRYFLEVDGTAPVVIENPSIDPERKTVTKQLFVVCEEQICQPLGHPLWEIAGFGRAEIVNQWQVELFQVFKLVPLAE